MPITLKDVPSNQSLCVNLALKKKTLNVPSKDISNILSLYCNSIRSSTRIRMATHFLSNAIVSYAYCVLYSQIRGVMLPFMSISVWERYAVSSPARLASTNSLIWIWAHWEVSSWLYQSIIFILSLRMHGHYLWTNYGLLHVKFCWIVTKIMLYRNEKCEGLGVNTIS